MTAVQTEGPVKAKRKGFFGGAKSLVYLALILGALAAFGSLNLLGSAADKSPYYVLNTPVAARTPITPAMLTQVQTSKGSAPPTSYDLSWVQTHPDEAFSKYALSPGDVLTPSNVGPLERINAAVPASYVVTSFQVDASDAVGGKITAGDYIEIAATTDAGAGQGQVNKIVLHHVLVVDVTVNPASIPAAATEGQVGPPGPDSVEVRAGIPVLYTVALSPQDFTKLNIAKTAKLSLALSPREPGATVNAQTNGSVLTENTPVADSNPIDGKPAVVPSPEAVDPNDPTQQPASDGTDPE